MQIKRQYRRGKKSLQEYLETVRELEMVLPWNQDQAEKIHHAIVIVHWDQGEMREAVKAFVRGVVLTQPELDPAFDFAYIDALEATGTIPVPFRRRLRFHRMLQEFVQGESVECGCYQGLASHLICSRQYSKHHIFDSFQGLSKPGPEDTFDPSDELMASMCREGHFSAEQKKKVEEALKDFDVAFHPGWIPESFKGLPEKTFGFVHLDVDLYAPTKGALEYFGPRSKKIVCDDYNWAGAKKAVDEYCQEKDLTPVITEFGQAIIEPKTPA